MRLRVLLVVSVAPLFLGQMCGVQEAPPPPDCLEIADVIGIPTGTATGTGFSGTYSALSAVVDVCLECASNTVPDPYCSAPVVEGFVLEVVQQDGLLTMSHPDLQMAGRVDADGSFEVGGVGAPNRDDGLKTGQALAILRGTITGNLMVAELRSRITAQSQDGQTLDGEQTATITARRDLDSCKDDPEKLAPGICGCGVPDTDSDGDTIADCQDFCPQDSAKQTAGACGCGASDLDSDGDGVADCIDECPDDPDKTVPGTLGCGIAEASLDSDGDGVSDPADSCPFDPDKTDLGLCGCFIPDSDLDGDLWPDFCFDNCPLTSNPDQADSDRDGIGDACDSALASTGTILVAQDGQFLGNVNTNQFDVDSLANQFGTYGSRFGQASIWNPLGTYGGTSGIYSAWNSFTVTPPIVIENGVFVGYVTTNALLTPSITPNALALWMGRNDATR